MLADCGEVLLLERDCGRSVRSDFRFSTDRLRGTCRLFEGTREDAEEDLSWSTVKVDLERLNAARTLNAVGGCACTPIAGDCEGGVSKLVLREKPPSEVGLVAEPAGVAAKMSAGLM